MAILSGFIDWNNQTFEFEKIFEDLELAGLPNDLIYELREKYDKRIKVIASVSNCSEEKKQITKTHKPNEFIESNKTAWIDQISKGEIQTTLDDIKNYSKEAGNIQLTKKIVNLSSRWYRIKQTYNSGTIENKEKEREINRINEALIDLIMAIN